MSALSDYLEDKIIDHIFRTASFTPPATLYFSLHTGTTTDAGGGTEVSAGGYARIGVTANTSNFDAPITGDGHTQNTNAITFGTPSANWGTVTHFAIWDAASVGNMLAHGALTASKTINNGDPGPEFAAGTFDITFTMGSDYLDDKLANWLFRGQAFTKPTSLNFGLFTAAPTAAGGGTECTGGSYARVAVTPLDANFAAPVTGDGHTENSGSIVFPSPTANWGSVLASAVYDQSSNLICFQTFTAKTVNNGDTAPRILAGGFDYTIAEEPAMPKFADRVKETTTTTGTGTYNLGGASTGYRAFSAAFVTTDTVYYCVEDGVDWETGIGTLTTGSPWTLARTTILASSNAGAAVNWAAGTRNVFCAGVAGALDVYAATGKTTPVDADVIGLIDSAAANVLKKLTWANLKAAFIATAQTWGAAQTFRAASAVRSEAASTQDAMVLAGRAGGTSSYAVTLTPTTLTANRTATFPDADMSVGYLNVPQNSQSTAYTAVLADSGKHLLHPSADTTARTFTIPANSSVAYPIGTALTFVNQASAGVMTIAITTDTMRLAGAGTTGSRTLAANGIATALKLTSTEWIISGTGLT